MTLVSIFLIFGVFLLIYSALSILIPNPPSWLIEWGNTNAPMGMVSRVGMFIFAAFLVLATSGLISESFLQILIAGIVIGAVIAIAGGFIDHTFR